MNVVVQGECLPQMPAVGTHKVQKDIVVCEFGHGVFLTTGSPALTWRKQTQADAPLVHMSVDAVKCSASTLIFAGQRVLRYALLLD